MLTGNMFRIVIFALFVSLFATSVIAETLTLAGGITGRETFDAETASIAGFDIGATAFDAIYESALPLFQAPAGSLSGTITDSDMGDEILVFLSPTVFESITASGQGILSDDDSVTAVAKASSVIIFVTTMALLGFLSRRKHRVRGSRRKNRVRPMLT